ncbi:MAG TPA: NUDIX hydrolase [Candidatus Babeliales bacterium]|nr:NUDIX hydrolase [Candidatus Babeliales bacterium]
MEQTNSLQHLLANYLPTDPAEQEYKTTILAFLDQYPNAFERSLDVGHITASAWLVNKDNTKALLTHHRKLDMWVQLGGHCDGNTDPLAVATKEAQEESGIMGVQPVSCDIFDIDIHLIPENKKEKAHYHYDVRFLLQVVGDEEAITSDESHALAWIDKNRDNLPTNERSVVRMFDKWLDRI